MTLGSFLTARDRLRQSPGLATAGPRWAGDQMESHTSSVAQPPSSLASCSPVPGALTHPPRYSGRSAGSAVWGPGYKDPNAATITVPWSWEALGCQLEKLGPTASRQSGQREAEIAHSGSWPAPSSAPAPGLHSRLLSAAAPLFTDGA